MKKIIALLAVSMLLASCGTKMNDTTVKNNTSEPVVIEETETPVVVEEVLTEDEINAAINDLFS
jgi:protein involved in sex pheromone biosynthesis